MLKSLFKLFKKPQIVNRSAAEEMQERQAALERAQTAVQNLADTGLFPDLSPTQNRAQRRSNVSTEASSDDHTENPHQGQNPTVTPRRRT